MSPPAAHTAGVGPVATKSGATRIVPTRHTSDEMANAVIVRVAGRALSLGKKPHTREDYGCPPTKSARHRRFPHSW